MSSNTQRSSRRTRQAASSSDTSSSSNGHRSQRNGRVRAVANDKKTYFVDSSDDEDDIQVTKTVASPTKKLATANGHSASKAASKMNMEQVEKLESITGLARAEAIELLEACEQSLERAIEIHFGGVGGGGVDSKGPSKKTSSRGINGMKRSHKEIDCDAISISDDSNSQSSVTKYENEDGVRAPIAPTFARLCDYDPYAVELPSQKRSRVDGFRNMREEFDESLATGSSRRKNFSTLFRPPIDLIFAGSFEASKAKACLVNKWVMLNVQSHDDFACKCLNRDLWSDETVKEIIKANFIFNQVYFDSIEGQKMVNIYNIHAYPFIGIIDPRTGEKLIQLPANKLDSCSFCEKITSFLCDFEMPIEDDTESSEVVKVEEDEVVVLNGGNKKEFTNGHTSNAYEKLMEKKPQRAADILNTDNDIFDCQDTDSNDTIKDDSYEDDTVVSKDKYDKHKQLKFKKIETSTKENGTGEKAVASGEVDKPVADVTPVDKNYQPRIMKHTTTDPNKKDCSLRVSFPNGDRLDFSTSGDSKLKYLIEYLIKEGYRMDTHELIERLMPTFMSSRKNQPTTSNPASSDTQSILDITEQSRNLFHKDPNLTFKQLNLYPRVALLLQES